MSYTIRFANSYDFNDLIEFYTAERSANLPAPSPRAIGQAIENYQLLVVVGGREQIVATAGTFDVTPPTAQHFVGELAGTRVTGALRTQPVRMQTVLIVLRVLSFALNGFDRPDSAATDTLIVMIRKGNDKSKTNILHCGFETLSDRPAWLLYDEISWNGKISENEWDYFFATEATARRCASLYFEAQMDQGHLHLSVEQHPIRVRIKLPGFQYHAEELRLIASGQHRAGFGPPPERLLLSERPLDS